MEYTQDEYLERHYYKNQSVVIDGVPVDPDLRWDFEVTDNNDRDPREIDDWWDKPFIRSQGFTRDTYIEYKLRMSDYDDLDNEEDWKNRRAEELKKWFEWYPDGYRYDVRCLDGGAWDRSTNLGHYSSLKCALDAIKEKF